MFFTGRPCTTSRTASSVILPDLVRGMSATATIFAGTWRGLAPVRIFCADALFEHRVVERDARAQPHEQHDAHVVVPILADADRLDDLRHLLDLVVDLRRADAHAAGIERRVGAAMDDDAAMLGPFGEIAMAPDIRRSARNRRRDTSCRPDRSRSRPASTGNGLVQTSSPFSCAHRLAVVVPDIDRHAEAGPWISPRQTG